MARVAGKVALVTGAGGGIGGAGAEVLAREGAVVFCTDRDGAAAEATVARIRAAGGRAAASALDVRDRMAVDNVTSQLAEVARPERAAYVASKGGARSLTQAMAI